MKEKGNYDNKLMSDAGTTYAEPGCLILYTTNRKTISLIVDISTYKTAVVV